jgi:hypothetical protein
MNKIRTMVAAAAARTETMQRRGNAKRGGSKVLELVILSEMFNIRVKTTSRRIFT